MKKCIACEQELIGSQSKYCSIKCKSKITNRLYKKYEQQSKKGYENKLYFFTLKGGCCEICGYKKNLAAIEFHHRDKSKKSFLVNMRSFGNNSRKTIEDEIKRCMMICSNCHRETHNPKFSIN